MLYFYEILNSHGCWLELIEGSGLIQNQHSLFWIRQITQTHIHTQTNIK